MSDWNPRELQIGDVVSYGMLPEEPWVVHAICRDGRVILRSSTEWPEFTTVYPSDTGWSKVPDG